MPKTTLTDAAINRLKPPKSGQIDYWDRTLGGFGLRIGANGKRTFNVQARVLVSGVRKDVRVKIGTYPGISLAEARVTAQHYKALASQGKDPRRAKEEAEKRLVTESINTFGSVRDQFLAEYGSEKLRDSSLHNYRKSLSGSDFKTWEQRPIRDITRRDVRDLLAGIKSRAPTSANRTLAYLRKMMSWSVEHEIIDASPCDDVSAVAKEVKRDRILDDAEIRSVWEAFETAGAEFEIPYKLMLLLGQRESEIIGMRRSELTTWGSFLGSEINSDEYTGIDAAEPIWIIPRGRTKRDREHVVPLPPLSQALINRVADNHTDLMFVSKRSNTKATKEKRSVRPLSGFSRSKARIDAVSGVADWRLHDLRRTLRSGLARMRISSDVARKVVNHKLVGMDEIYDRYLYLPERRSALYAWNNLIDGIINGNKADNITEFPPIREKRA